MVILQSKSNINITSNRNHSDFINISKQLLRGKYTMMSMKENEMYKYTEVPQTIKLTNMKMNYREN